MKEKVSDGVDIGGSKTAMVLIAALTAVQLWGLTRYFPINSWMDRHPFYTNSYALHFARGLLSASALARHFRLWSYSPILMAGYPAGTRTEPMGDAVALWFWLWTGAATMRSIGRAAILFKVFVIGSLLCVPAAAASAALWLGFDWSVVTIAAALGVFGTFNYGGLLMIRAGMFAFFSASFLCVAWSALLYDSLDRGVARLVGLAISGALLTYLHPLSSILLVPASIGGLAESRTLGRFLSLSVALAAVFLLSLGWLGPLLLTAGIGVHFANWWKTPETIGSGLAALFRWRLPFPPFAMMVAAAYGASRARLRKRFMVAWLAATFGIGLLAYFGSGLKPFADLEPGRFEVVFFAFAAPLVALGTRRAWVSLGELQRPLSWTVKTVAVIALMFFALVSLASLWLETSRHGPITTSLPDQAQEIRGWMRASGSDSRIVLESGWILDENGGVVSPYFQSDVGMLWAIESEREVIGASPSEGFSSFSFTDMGNGTAFGRPLSELTPSEFRRQLETYNVGSLIVWSDDAKQFVEGIEGLVPLQRSDPYMFYGVAGNHSYLMAGKAASIRARADCIAVKAAEPGRLVLKYHYFKTLRTDPPVPLGPQRLDNGDPNAFIRIDNDATRDISVYNAGFTGWGQASRACD